MEVTIALGDFFFFFLLPTLPSGEGTVQQYTWHHT